jgi:hypothetical protein
MTTVSMEFWRDSRCEHDPRRECTACFRATIVRFIGEDEEARVWADLAKNNTSNPEVADSLSYYYESEHAQLEQSLVMIPR